VNQRGHIESQQKLSSAYTESVLEILEDHAHKPSQVYPALADPVTLADGGAAWTQGALTEIIPASTITDIFDIHFAFVSEPDANDDYQIDFYYGASDTWLCNIAFSRSGVWSSSISLPVQSPRVAANSRIRAKLATGDGGRTCKVKVYYHDY